jgi:ABC-type multidrug transport system fused ATPase/permease subunit
LVTPLCYFSKLQILSFLPTMHNRITANLSSGMESQSNHEFHIPKDVIQSLSWSNISLTVEDRSTKHPKDLVADVCGCIEAGKCSATFFSNDNMVDVVQGKVLALMGPSGSGKTTLLNVLAGRASATKGSVLVDGTCVSAPDYKKLTSFVEQEDTLVGCLTVRETLDFAARLSLPR